MDLTNPFVTVFALMWSKCLSDDANLAKPCRYAPGTVLQVSRGVIG